MNITTHAASPYHAVPERFGPISGIGGKLLRFGAQIGVRAAASCLEQRRSNRRGNRRTVAGQHGQRPTGIVVGAERDRVGHATECKYEVYDACSGRADDE